MEQENRVIGYLRKKVSVVYLIYLGALPAIATFAALRRWGSTIGDGEMLLYFVVGVAAVGVYTAFVMSYQLAPTSIWRTLVLLLDGPILIFLSTSGDLATWDFAIEGYVVDGTVVWLSILLLALVSPDPTPGQRKASVLIMLGAILMTGLFFWPYISAELLGDKVRMGWLLFAIVEGLVMSPLLVSMSPETVDSPVAGDFPWFILAMLGLWVLALFVGRATAG